MRASKNPHRSNGKYESIKFELIKSVFSSFDRCGQAKARIDQMRSTNRSSSNQSSLFFNHLIDAGKQKPASIKWEPVRIDRRRQNPFFFNHLIDADKKKTASIKWEPIRIDQGESTRAVRTYVRPNPNFKISQRPKTQKKKTLFEESD